MTTTKHTLNELFFKKTGKVYRFNKNSELETPIKLDDFYLVMIDAVGLCSDKNVLDHNRLKLLYDRYMITFFENKQHFSDKLLSSYRKCISKDLVFGELLPSTKSVATLDFFKNRCYLNAEEMLYKRQNQTSKEAFIRKYGEIDGVNRFNEFCNKIKNIYYKKGESYKKVCKERLQRNFKNFEEYYLNKINENTGNPYTKEEIKNAISEYQKQLAKKANDKKIERNNKYHDVSCRQVNYWLNKGYTYKESLQKVKNIQNTNNVETYIKKYGYELGVIEWEKRNNKWGKQMLSLRSKYGKTGSSYSKAACALFDTVINCLSNDGIVFKKVFYGETEFSKWDSKNNRIYFYDFVINDIKLCVEYNGIMFHPKPGDYNWKSLYGKTYNECIKYDTQKQQLIKDFGYELLVVWEDDVFENLVKTIVNKCKELININ